MDCPECGGELIGVNSFLFDGEELKQCRSCGALWDNEQLEITEEVKQAQSARVPQVEEELPETPSEDHLEHFESLQEVQEYFRRNEAPSEDQAFEHKFDPEEEDEGFTETELTNNELADDLNEDDLSTPVRRVTYENIEDDQNPYDWMGA